MLLSHTAFAQEDENWIFKSPFSGKYYGNPYEVRKDYFAKSESGRFSIQSVADVQQIISKKLVDEVIAIELGNISTTELPSVFALLDQFPKLVYIRILGKGTPNQNEKVDQLVANIHKLSQLKGIEFAYTDKINMDDALKKLIPLKQLHILSFTEYERELPAVLISLKQIDSIKLNTLNIGNNDISGANWQKVGIVGNPNSWSDSSGVLAKEQEKSLLRLAQVSSLKQLDLYADLRYPEIISKFTQLNALHVYDIVDDKSALPFAKAIGSLTQLQKLSIGLVCSGHAFNISPLQNLTQLRSFYLKLNGDRCDGFEVLNNFKNLEFLAMVDCKINVIPDVFKNIQNLKTVILANNEISKVPVSLFNLPQLEHLDLFYNRLIAIPEIISYGCTKLKYLNLRVNKLSTLPKAITGLTLLENFDCSENQLQTVPNEWEYLKNLKTVNFRVNGLTDFPGGLQNNTNVEEIDISSNRALTTIPDITGDGYQLMELNLAALPLEYLPEHIGKYKKLTTLIIAWAKLKSLPESLGDCKELKTLQLTRSIAAKTVLPAGLKDAKYLERLDLSENPLLDHQSIFDVILAMPRKSLSVNLNRDSIKQLPSTKKWLTAPFTSIDLSNNPIDALPVEFIDSKVKGNVNTKNTNIKVK
ncbi:MAG: leucine-rich repeat domain-containing protein [Bacteroidota bacterium]